MVMIILNPNRLRHQTKTKITYLGKLISNILQAIDRGHDDPRNGIWDDPICLVWLSAWDDPICLVWLSAWDDPICLVWLSAWDDPICLVWLSAYGSVYSKVEDDETENKTQSDIKFTKWETIPAAAVLTWSRTMSYGWELGQPVIICCAVHLWKATACLLFWSVQFFVCFCQRHIHWASPLFHNTACQHFVFEACVPHDLSSWLGHRQSCTLYSGTPHLWIYFYFHFWAEFQNYNIQNAL